MLKRSDEKQKQLETELSSFQQAFTAAMGKNNLVERYQDIVALQAKAETRLETTAVPHPAVPVSYIGGLGGLLTLTAENGLVLGSTPLSLGVLGVSVAALLLGFAVQDNMYVPKKQRVYEAAREGLIAEMQSEVSHILSYDIAKMSKQKGFRELLKNSETVRKAFDRASKVTAVSLPSLPADKKKLAL